MPDYGKRHKSHQKLARGLATSRNRLTLRSGDALIAQNCDRETSDAVRRRNGNEFLYQFVTDEGTPTPVVNFYNHEWDYPCRGPIHRHLFALQDGSIWMREPGSGFSVVRVTGADLDDVLTDHVSFVTVNGDTFIAVGKGRLRLFDGERLWFAGIEPPTDRPSATAGAAGSLSGDFLYKITYIYETDETSRESGPSPLGGFNGTTSPITVASTQVDLTWNAHPNAVAPGNGERCNGYRIYRTVDLSQPDADDSAYLLVAEINDVTVTSYTDDTASTELTDLAPLERPIPPDGTKLLAYHSDSMFFGSPRFNRVGYSFSETDEPEYVPTGASNKLQGGSTSSLTAFYFIAGTFGCMTEDEIFTIAGSSPSDFVPRTASKFTGCLSPNSIQVFNEVAAFVGKHGIFAWNGGEPVNLTQDTIEDGVKDLPFDAYRATCSSIYPRRNHYYVAMDTPQGGRHIWVLDYTAESLSIGDGSEAELSEPRLSRAWFEYTGMRATSMGTVRSYEDKDTLLYWGDEEGNVLLFDRGDTDAGKNIELRYRYVFKPAEGRQANPVNRKFRVREIVPLTDRFTGAIRVGLQYLVSHTPQMFYKPWRNRSGETFDEEGKATEERFSHNGEGAAIVEIGYRGRGEFRLLAVSHEWQALTKRHQKV